MANEAFTAACGFVMPLGQHKGKTLARIGNNDEGLRYLDWLVGQGWIHGPTRAALETYLKHPAVAMQVNRLVET
jgi:hypothetical protein